MSNIGGVSRKGKGEISGSSNDALRIELLGSSEDVVEYVRKPILGDFLGHNRKRLPNQSLRISPDLARYFQCGVPWLGEQAWPKYKNPGATDVAATISPSQSAEMGCPAMPYGFRKGEDDARTATFACEIKFQYELIDSPFENIGYIWPLDSPSQPLLSNRSVPWQLGAGDGMVLILGNGGAV